MNFKSKRVKINTIWLDSGSKSHNIWKSHFTAIKANTLTGYSQKVDFFIQPLNHVEF